MRDFKQFFEWHLTWYIMCALLAAGVYGMLFGGP